MRVCPNPSNPVLARDWIDNNRLCNTASPSGAKRDPYRLLAYQVVFPIEDTGRSRSVETNIRHLRTDEIRAETRSVHKPAACNTSVLAAIVDSLVETDAWDTL